MSLCLEGKLRAPVCEWLVEHGLTPVFEVYMSHGTCDIIGVEFFERVGRRLPDIKCVHAIELKRSNFAGVLVQATKHQPLVHATWAAMPIASIEKARDSTLTKFAIYGVGLLGISEHFNAVDIVTPAMLNKDNLDFSRMRNKLWRRREEWRERLNR